jgi:preprotein translocase subunit YajC
VSLVARATGGLSLDLRIFWGFVLVVVAIGVLAFFGRRRQRKATAERAEQIAARR